MSAARDILTINLGSSSLKFSLWEGEREVTRGEVERIGSAPRLTIDGASEQDWGEAGASLSPEDILRDVLDRLVARRGGAEHLSAIGHRIVHGGARFGDPVVVDDAILDALDRLAPLAPLHQPHGVAGIRACRALRPGLTQVAAFDTAFHRTIPDEAALYGLPRDLIGAGVRRYGFHGLSFAHVARRLADAEPGLRRVVIAHLGSGASLCALREGVSLDTTMGLTPLDGLVMGTRPGLLDPGIVTWLMRERGLDADALEDLLNRRSGLFGLSGGIASDMRTLLASDVPEAAEAVAVFVHRAAREIAAMAASLGGLDAIVFTAGIGEHSAEIRARIAARCAWLGAELDPAANAGGNPGRISTAASRVALLVVPTDEEAEIARAVRGAVASRLR